MGTYYVEIIHCPEAKKCEAYDWCELYDQVCLRNSGNPDFDTKCDYFNDFLQEYNKGD